MSKNFTSVFHVLIITVLVLSFSACGYKAPPKYVDDKKVEKIK